MRVRQEEEHDVGWPLEVHGLHSNERGRRDMVFLVVVVLLHESDPGSDAEREDCAALTSGYPWYWERRGIF